MDVIPLLYLRFLHPVQFGFITKPIIQFITVSSRRPLLPRTTNLQKNFYENIDRYLLQFFLRNSFFFCKLIFKLNYITLYKVSKKNPRNINIESNHIRSKLVRNESENLVYTILLMSIS